MQPEADPSVAPPLRPVNQPGSLSLSCRLALALIVLPTFPFVVPPLPSPVGIDDLPLAPMDVMAAGLDYAPDAVIVDTQPSMLEQGNVILPAVGVGERQVCAVRYQMLIVAP